MHLEVSIDYGNYQLITADINFMDSIREYPSKFFFCITKARKVVTHQRIFPFH